MRMVFEIREQAGQCHGALASCRRADWDLNPETLRNWVNQADVDGGQCPGTSTHARQRIAELDREVRERERRTAS
jgi:transposase